MCVPCFGYRTTEAVDPKKLEFPQDSQAGRRERLDPWPARGESFQKKKIHNWLDCLTEERMMGQKWQHHTLTRAACVGAALLLCLKRNLKSRPWKWAWEESH